MSKKEQKKQKLKRFVVETVSTFAEFHIVHAKNEKEAKFIAKNADYNSSKWLGQQVIDISECSDDDVKKLKKSTAVWSQNALRDVSNATMSEKDTEEVNKYLSEAGKLFNQIAGSTLRALEQNQELAGMIETFNNSFVRSGTIITDSTKHADNLIKYIHAKFQKEMDKRSTEKGKTAQADKRDALLAFFSPENKSSLIKNIFVNEITFSR